MAAEENTTVTIFYRERVSRNENGIFEMTLITVHVKYIGTTNTLSDLERRGFHTRSIASYCPVCRVASERRQIGHAVYVTNTCYD